MRISDWSSDVCSSDLSQTIAIPDSVTGDPTQSSLMTNIGKVRTWGADLIVSAENVLIDGLSLDANASWIDAEVTRNPLNPALRSEEHTSELQSLMRISYAVFCLKKKQQYTLTLHSTTKSTNI